MSKSIILVLNFYKRNLELLTQVLEQANYQVLAMGNYIELEQAIDNTTTINLALIDLTGCDRRIWNYCQQLQANDIPFITFTPQRSQALEQGSLACGARSVLVKPLVIKNLLLLIHSLVGKPS